ncbi:gliding motility protein SprC [Flavobacterium sp. LHD-85]|uniref:gliding motility protein SprC n=1 Tax=Flavobacterium sp. LHD-85 TaxID=3071410 RepID=UPI0027DFDD28|nr:gliding motility protein SprC [Flavobacterium sp. LHD-85]MDQ6528629.1 gliding motility protein SprC [Flavobacterium sp. LHD-85]
MIQKITLSFFKVILLFSILLFARSNSYAQTIVPLQLDGLEKLCAGNSFNEFYATFSYVNFPEGTTFAVELLDASNNPIATTLLQTVDVSATQKTIKFAVPTSLVGSETYGLRVKSSTSTTSPRFKNSLGNTSFPAYFKDYETTFSINNKDTNATLCAGGSLTLSIDNATPSVPSSSPVNYPNLKYTWFKDNVAIVGQSGKTLTVNAVGDYYVVIDYGSCTDVNFSSNHVNVATTSSGSAVTINSSLGNPFCASGTGTILTATSGNKYQWKKDGNIINGATNRTYSTNESGVYSVEVDFGGCTAIGTINLQSNGFNASIDAQDGYKLSEGETITVTITTDAVDPTYEWYLNGNLIAGETSNSYLVAVKGNYTAKVSQSSGCVASREFSFKINGESGPSSVIPNIIKLSGDIPYWNIPDEYKNANTKVMIISSNGDMVLDVVNYQGDWPQSNIDFKNVNPVYYYVIQSDTGEKKGSITVIK